MATHEMALCASQDSFSSPQKTTSPRIRMPDISRSVEKLPNRSRDPMLSSSAYPASSRNGTHNVLREAARKSFERNSTASSNMKDLRSKAVDA